MSNIMGQDLKLLIKSIDPATIMDAALSVAETKWVMGIHLPANQNRSEWVEDQAINLFQQLHSEINNADPAQQGLTL
jgi:hypothetical protein